MGTENKLWHDNFLDYMEMIVSHPNYSGLPFTRKDDGLPAWIATAKSDIGKKRIEWAIKKANDLGIKNGPGVYAKVMLTVHPTKSKVCQTCGLQMSLYYHYPNVHLLKKMKKEFGIEFSMTDHIEDIWNELLLSDFSNSEIAMFFVSYCELNVDLSNCSRNTIIDVLENECRNNNKKFLGPGAMSNFPDRYDGFHTYNRCCRSIHDKGRSKENLKSYTKDRRAYEYWSDGNIHAANKFMGSSFFDGVSADHIGPISLGFVHDSNYLQPMGTSDNSAKRDRLQFEDIETLISVEVRTNTKAISWYSEVIWEYIKNNYLSNTEKIETLYRDALKQNLSDFMYILWKILISCEANGMQFLSVTFLEQNYSDFAFDYKFNEKGEILEKKPRHITDRSVNEFERYKRIAFESVFDYNNKDNRNVKQNLVPYEKTELKEICDSINAHKDINEIKNRLVQLVTNIQKRIIYNAM